MIDFYTVRQAATDRWLEILLALGVPSEKLNGKHQSCLGCGGRDRFRYAGGDGFDLLCHVHGWGKHESLMAVADCLSIQSDQSPEAQKKAMELAKQSKAREYEKALAQELRILLIVLESRITGRELSSDRHFMKVRPEYAPLPESYWEREEKAAQRVATLLGILYQAGKRIAS
ncbi:MAG: hypothetical protein RPU64_04135 [Candidatus Sedimenticola sp. (ex Thyasira tokunagai)]